MITQKELDDIAEEFKKVAIPAERCHYCKSPVYRLPFQEAPRKNGKVMCLECMGRLYQYENLTRIEYPEVPICSILLTRQRWW